MEQIKLYFYTDPVTNKEMSTEQEMPITSSKVKYFLAAQPGHFLYNEKHDISCKSILIPFYELQDWEEKILS